MTDAENNKDGLFVPARRIPVPRTISPQAQAFLSNPPPVGQDTQPDDLNDRAAWRAYIQEHDIGLTKFSSRLASAYPSDIVTHHLATVPLYEVVPENLDAGNEARAILYVHGGGFLMGGGDAASYAAMPIATLAQTRAYAIDYRMPPDHPFPAGLEDVVEAYRWLLERYKPGNIGLYGASAGGNLAPAALLKARALGLPMPAACALHSPASDLTESGDSYETNDTVDIVLRHRSRKLFALYAGDHDLEDPLVSPLFGNYTEDFPPTVLTTGTRDLLLSSTVLLHRALRRAGVKAELHVFEAMTHALFFGAPEERELYKEQIRFLLAHMGGD